jgi:hypothetical protein
MRLSEDWLAVVMGFVFMALVVSGILVKVPW